MLIIKTKKGACRDDKLLMYLGSNQRKMTHDVRRKYCFFPFFKLDNIISFFCWANIENKIYVFKIFNQLFLLFSRLL